MPNTESDDYRAGLSEGRIAGMVEGVAIGLGFGVVLTVYVMLRLLAPDPPLLTLEARVHDGAHVARLEPADLQIGNPGVGERLA